MAFIGVISTGNITPVITESGAIAVFQHSKRVGEIAIQNRVMPNHICNPGVSQYRRTQFAHHPKHLLDFQQVFDFPGLALPIIAARAHREIAHQQQTIQGRSFREGIQHLVQVVPASMNVANHTENGAQNEIRICIKPYTRTMTTN